MTHTDNRVADPSATHPRKAWTRPEVALLAAEDAQSAPIPGIGDGSFSMGS